MARRDDERRERWRAFGFGAVLRQNQRLGAPRACGNLAPDGARFSKLLEPDFVDKIQN
jgi:hypothetical protein